MSAATASETRSERSHTSTASASGIAAKMAPGITSPVSAISIIAPMPVATKPATARVLTCDLPSPGSLARGCEDGVNSAECNARATREHHQPSADDERHERCRAERRVDADRRAEDAHGDPAPHPQSVLRHREEPYDAPAPIDRRLELHDRLRK